ncbi:MAG TPA: hypothetical protein VN851_05475 [Thermoanaerobaculia bacterium]|nr:hypothetical protein [Thermoanaerobaculia bacterium]
MRKITIFLTFLLLAVSTSHAAVSGKIGRKGVTVNVVDAVLYEGKDFFGDDPALILRLSAAKLDHAAIDEAIDLDGEIDRQVEGSPNVTLEFRMDGSWSGGGGYYIPEASCGWCQDGAIAEMAKTKFEKDVLSGTIKVVSATLKDGDGPDIDLTLSVPIYRVKGLTELPKGGGEPARAYLACAAAMTEQAKPDKAAVISACFAKDDAWVANLNLENYPEFADLTTPVRYEIGKGSMLEEVKVLSGRTKGKRAALEVEGKLIDRSSEPPSIERYRGQVFLALTGDGWRLRGGDIEPVYD